MNSGVSQSRVGATRRHVVRGAAWSVPVVALATTAPAFAVSCDRQAYTMNWTESRFSRTDFRRATGYAHGSQVGNTALAVALTSNSFSNGVLNNNVATANNRPDVDRNLTIPPTADGADANLDPGVTSLGGRANERGIRLQHTRSDPGRGNRQEVTINFSRPVRGLSFYITDIDRISYGSYGYSDRVELTSVPAVVPPTRTQTLDGTTGVGVQNDPWLRTANENRDENAAGAQVRVAYPSSSDISSLTLTYWNAAGTDIYHRVFIGNMTFTAVGC